MNLQKENFDTGLCTIDDAMFSSAWVDLNSHHRERNTIAYYDDEQI